MNVVWARCLVGTRLTSNLSIPIPLLVILTDGDFGKGLDPTARRGRLPVEKNDEIARL